MAVGSLVPRLRIYVASSAKELSFGRYDEDIALVTLHFLTRCPSMGTARSLTSAHTLKLFGGDLESFEALRKCGSPGAVNQHLREGQIKNYWRRTLLREPAEAWLGGGTKCSGLLSSGEGPGHGCRENWQPETGPLHRSEAGPWAAAME